MEKSGAPSSNYFIYFAVLAVNLITFTAGGCWSWTSPILPKLSSLDPSINPLPRPTTSFEDSWIAAIMNLGAVIGPLAGGFFSEKVGKKKALLIMGVPMALSHVLCAFATNVHFFIAARFLIGMGVGTVFCVVPGYVGDIAEDRNRGVLGSLLGVINCLGVLFMYTVGPFLSVRSFSLINVVPVVLFYLLFGWFIPESPYDLVKRGQQELAAESLMKLRNRTYNQVEKELAFIVETIEASNGQRVGLMTLFKSRGLTKGLLISNGLMFFQQFSGICAVLGYMQTIFEMTGSSMPSIYSAILIGFIQLLSNLASAQLVERAGRKMLLIISHVFSIVALVTLGAYFYLKLSAARDVEQISWLPIASLILYIVAFNLGLANMPWVILAELFPAHLKAVASTATSFFCFFLSFLITMCFPFLSAALGMAGSFWIFAGFLVAGFTFCVMLVPETKGKSCQEIQNILEGFAK